MELSDLIITKYTFNFINNIFIHVYVYIIQRRKNRKENEEYFYLYLYKELLEKKRSIPICSRDTVGTYLTVINDLDITCVEYMNIGSIQSMIISSI